MLIPPLLALAPTPLPRGLQFVPLVICLLAVTPVALNSSVKVMLRMLDSPLTLVIVLGMKPRRCGNKESRRQKRDRQNGFSCHNCGESVGALHE
jgi:hypothetical protein